MAITYRTVYSAGFKCVQSQQTKRLRSLFFFFLCWIVYACVPPTEIHILSINQKALTTKTRKEKIKQLTWIFWLLLLISEQMVTSQWKFYKNFHLLTLSAGLKFFPGENVERESLSMLCSVCMGFSLTAFRKVRKPFHYSNWVFFSSPPGQTANSIISGSAVGTRKVQTEEEL